MMTMMGISGKSGGKATRPWLASKRWARRSRNSLPRSLWRSRWGRVWKISPRPSMRTPPCLRDCKKPVSRRRTVRCTRFEKYRRAGVFSGSLKTRRRAFQLSSGRPRRGWDAWDRPHRRAEANAARQSRRWRECPLLSLQRERLQFLRKLDPDDALPIEGDALRAGMFAHRYVRTRDDWMQVSSIAPAPLDRIYFERSRVVVIGTIQ